MSSPIEHEEDAGTRAESAAHPPDWSATNHRGKTPRDIVSDAVPGSLARAYEIADEVLTALDEAGFMVVTQEYVG